MPYLVQLLLPLYDNHGAAFSAAEFETVQNELTERFGGLTAYTRSPAEGHWKSHGKKATRDEIVVFEVMAERLDRAFWGGYRVDLEQRFRQDVIVLRAQKLEML